MKKNIKVKILVGTIVGIVLFFISVNALSQSRRTLKELRSAVDIENPTTRAFSLKLASAYPGQFSYNQIFKVYDHIKNNWKYVNDPRGLEYFSKASMTINNGLSGDCDDFAILLATVIESIGGATRISFAYSKEEGGHSFTEVYCGEDPQIIIDAINDHYQNILEYLLSIPKVDKLNFTLDSKNGIWLNLDWYSKYPGGKYFEYSRRTIYYTRENYYITE